MKEKINRSEKMSPKKFIKQTLIKEIGVIVEEGHDYIGFILIAIGIEFLGKCNDCKLKTWHSSKSDHFIKGIKLMPKNYHCYGKKLKNLLRNGMAHSFAPKPKLGLPKLGLSSKKWGLSNLEEKDGQLILVIEDFYNDFKKACKKVLEEEYPKEDKMNKNFLDIPIKKTSLMR